MHDSKYVPKEIHDKAQSDIRSTHSLFCLRDTDATGYGLPQPAINAALFLREMEMVFKNPDHPISKYPDKFEIYECGVYDFRSGELHPTGLRFIGLVSDFIPKPNYSEPTIARQ